MGAELSRADGQRDRQAGMTNQVTFAILRKLLKVKEFEITFFFKSALCSSSSTIVCKKTENG